MVQLHATGLKSVSFVNCKLLGIHFHHCTDFLFAVDFQDCILDYSAFANKKMPKTRFVNSSLKEVNFIGANLTQSLFDGSNLEAAIFNETQLGGADFRSAHNYKIDPEYNPMAKAKFSTQGIEGLLDKYDIKIE